MENGMNYEDMTDAQINEAVTNAVTRNLINELDCIDYCNDWAYGGLIIQKYKLSIMFDWEVEGLYTATGGATEQRNLGSYVKLVEFTHENPLRAAMIVYLIMNGEK